MRRPGATEVFGRWLCAAAASVCMGCGHEGERGGDPSDGASANDADVLGTLEVDSGHERVPSTGADGDAENAHQPSITDDAGNALDAGAPNARAHPGRARLLSFDGQARKLVTYDAAGDVVQDLWPLLGIDAPTNRVSIAWSGRTVRADHVMSGTSLRAPARDYHDAAPTRLLVATEQPNGGTRVVVYALDGTAVAQVELAERAQHLALSPKETHLLLQSSAQSSSLIDSVLVRVSDGRVVWRGAQDSAAFAPDDSHFVFTPGAGLASAGSVNLSSGATSAWQHPGLYKYESGVQLGVEACSPVGAVLRTYGWVTDGMPLWGLTWDVRIQPFDASLPRLADEWFGQFGRNGETVLWQRQARPPSNGLLPIDPGLLGWFEYDFGTSMSRPATPPDDRCPPGRSHRYEASSTALSACDCTSGACAFIHALPAISLGWSRDATVSHNGKFVLVSDHWAGNAIPDSYPDMLLFAADGTLVTSLPGGAGEFDNYDELLVVGSSHGTAIVELATGKVTQIGADFIRDIVYER